MGTSACSSGLAHRVRHVIKGKTRSLRHRISMPIGLSSLSRERAGSDEALRVQRVLRVSFCGCEVKAALWGRAWLVLHGGYIYGSTAANPLWRRFWQVVAASSRWFQRVCAPLKANRRSECRCKASPQGSWVRFCFEIPRSLQVDSNTNAGRLAGFLF